MTPRKLRASLPLLVVAVACARAVPPGVGEQPLALVGVHVLAMEGDRILPDQTVVVRDGRIEALGPRGAVDVPWNATRVEGQGRYLLPGLVDMHVHVTGERTLREQLARGVTTVRNMRGDPRHLAWRREIAEHERLGPRLITAGPPLAGEGETAPGVQVVPSAAAARAAVDDQAAAGFDFVKVYEGLSSDAYGAIIEEAAAQGLPVAGHVSAAVGIYAALAAGQASIEHAEELTQGAAGGESEMIRSLVEHARRSPSWICPTLTLHALFSPAEDHAFRMRLVAALERAGVGVLAGSDGASISVAQEVRSLAQAGLSPYRALLAATGDAARFLGRSDEFGTIAVGLEADLLLVDANPLEDLRTLEAPAGLAVRGEWLDAGRLRRLARR